MVVLLAAAWAAACADAPSGPEPAATKGSKSKNVPAGESGMRQPYSSLGMNTGQRDPAGRPVRIACVVCHHEAVQRKDENLHVKQLQDFHQGVVLEHGRHSNCVACHHPPDFAAFRLASGKVIEYGNVVELCAQCHGQQWEDYQNGAHGGMTGYWDLSRGERDRNHCLDCHNPHHPAAAQVQPAPRPRYRFLGEEGGSHE